MSDRARPCSCGSAHNGNSQKFAKKVSKLVHMGDAPAPPTPRYLRSYSGMGRGRRSLPLRYTGGREEIARKPRPPPLRGIPKNRLLALLWVESLPIRRRRLCGSRLHHWLPLSLGAHYTTRSLAIAGRSSRPLLRLEAYVLDDAGARCIGSNGLYQSP